jgi:hypothetical protein
MSQQVTHRDHRQIHRARHHSHGDDHHGPLQSAPS